MNSEMWLGVTRTSEVRPCSCELGDYVHRASWRRRAAIEHRQSPWQPPLLGRGQEPPPKERRARQRARKLEISHSLEQQRAAVRFAPSEDQLEAVSSNVVVAEAAPANRPSPALPASGGVTAAIAEEPTYTSSLLDAKRRQQRQHTPRREQDGG